MVSTTDLKTWCIKFGSQYNFQGTKGPPISLSGSLIATNMKLLPVWPLLFSFQVALATTTADILSNIANISTALDTFSAAISKGLSIPSSVSYSYITDHCILPLTINENFTARSSRLCSTMGLL